MVGGGDSQRSEDPPVQDQDQPRSEGETQQPRQCARGCCTVVTPTSAEDRGGWYLAIGNGGTWKRLLSPDDVDRDLAAEAWNAWAGVPLVVRLHQDRGQPRPRVVGAMEPSMLASELAERVVADVLRPDTVATSWARTAVEHAQDDLADLAAHYPWVADKVAVIADDLDRRYSDALRSQGDERKGGSNMNGGGDLDHA